jgi:hypothetical protein
MIKSIFLKLLNYLIIFASVGILWHMSIWEKDEIPWPFDSNDFLKSLYNNYLYSNRYKYGLGIAAVVGFQQIFLIGNPFSQKRKKIVNSILDHLIKDKFNGLSEINRITVFQKVSGFRIIISHSKKCFYDNWKEHKKKGLISFYFLKEFPNPLRHYLVQVGRYGHPNPTGSSTKFLFPYKESEVSGIGAYSAFTENQVRKKLPVLNEVEIHKVDKITKLNKNIREAVNRYMKEGKINSFEKLKSFHRYPNKIFASPIRLQNEEIWGVVVFDAKEEDDSTFENSYQHFVEYCRIIETVTRNLN